ncbi:MAG: hypothetical protein ACHQ49_08220 [Elusimicrobiota bacterium]
MRRAWLAAALSCAALPAAAGLLTGQGAAVLNASGAPATSFSLNETIGFNASVNNAVASANRLSFAFEVVAPNGNVVFKHLGNSVRGTVGNAASSISGVPISGFSQGPGTYTLKAMATLDGQTVAQSATFVVSSPNLVLIYPPNGSANLTDNPLTFQWYSSGASTYRVTVGDNPSLYNAYFIQTTAAGAHSLTYPQNPTDTRERLSTGQTYYWTVVGLDVNGNIVASAAQPFSFSVANTSLTRDLAVTGLSVTGPPDSAGNYPFLVTVADQGNTTESNTPLRVTVGGLAAAGTPINVPQMSPGDVLTFGVSAPIPTGMTQGIAIACLTIFDDNVNNNCMTMTVNQAPALSSGTISTSNTPMTAAQIWAEIQQTLKDEGIDLSEYNLTSMEGSMTQSELLDLLNQLRQGLVQTNLSGPPLTTLLGGPIVSSGTAAAPPAASTEAFVAPPVASSATAAVPTASTTTAPTAGGAPELTWSGTAPALSAKTLSVAIKKAEVWSRLWKRLNSDPVPEVDFSQHMVVAIIAGSEEKGDRIDIEDYRSEGDTLTVRYRLVAYARPFDADAGRAAGPKKSTQYLLTVIPRSVLKVKFQRLRED